MYGNSEIYGDECNWWIDKIDTNKNLLECVTSSIIWNRFAHSFFWNYEAKIVFRFKKVIAVKRLWLSDFDQQMCTLGQQFLSTLMSTLNRFKAGPYSLKPQVYFAL